jgi:hypothetical protein
LIFQIFQMSAAQAMKGGTAMHDPVYDLQTFKRGACGSGE